MHGAGAGTVDRAGEQPPMRLEIRKGAPSPRAEFWLWMLLAAIWFGFMPWWFTNRCGQWDGCRPPLVEVYYANPPS
jgi:hypothetical protein